MKRLLQLLTLSLTACATETLPHWSSPDLPPLPTEGPLESHPRLQAQKEAWRARKSEIPQAISLADPKLTVGVLPAEIETAKGPMRAKWGLSQSLPPWGSREAAAKRLGHLADADQATFRALFLDLQRDLVLAEADYALLFRTLSFLEAHQILLQQWEEVARKSWSTGKGKHADVLQSQIELAKIELRIDRLQAKKASQSAHIHHLRTGEAGQSAPLLKEEDVASLPVSLPSLVDFQSPLASMDWLEVLESQSPHVQKQYQTVLAEEAGIEWAESNNGLSLSLAVEHSVIQDGADALAVGIGINLPIHTEANEASVLRAKSKAAEARHVWRNLLSEKMDVLQQNLFLAEDALRTFSLYSKGLLLKSQEAIEVTQRAYQTDAASFFDLLQVQRTLLRHELATATAIHAFVRAKAQLRQITGTGLNER